MEWDIRGADNRTGKDIVKRYTARSEESARQQAHDDGILVESAEPVVEEIAWTPPAGKTTSGKASPATSPLPYRTPSMPASPIPPYRGLSVAGVILRVYAFLCYGIAGLWILILLAGTVMSTLNPTPPPGFNMNTQSQFALVIAGWAVALTPLLGILFAGTIAHGLGSACEALRDIARNSWKGPA